MKLITLGCSNTFGVGLPDIWNVEGNYGMHEHGPSKYAWPTVLADKLNLECVNLGKPGASVKEIWYNTLHNVSYKDSIVIILWPFFDRYCFLQKNEIMKVGTWMITDKLRRWHTEPNYEQSKAFFKYFYDEHDMLLDFYLRANHIQLFLQDKVELIKHHTVCEPQIDFDWNKIKPSLYMKNFSEQYLPKALDGGHPGLNAHEAFAIAIYNEIKDENTEKLN